MTKLTAKDLMVGDKVEVINSDHLKYVKVRNILDNSIITEEGEYESEEIKLENIKPIHLTAEILEKNGVVYAYERDVCTEDYTRIKWKGYQYNDENVLIDYCNGYIRIMNGIPAACVEMDINYVHELQHALRLCGIDKEIII